MSKIGELARRPGSGIDAQIVNYRDYVSHCKRCRLAVLRSQPWFFNTTPGQPLGITHEECEQ